MTRFIAFYISCRHPLLRHGWVRHEQVDYHSRNENHHAQWRNYRDHPNASKAEWRKPAPGSQPLIQPANHRLLFVSTILLIANPPLAPVFSENLL